LGSWPRISIISGRSAVAVASGDFNGDGLTDLAATNPNTPRAGPQQGSGRSGKHPAWQWPGRPNDFPRGWPWGFRRAGTIPSARPYPAAIVAVDFDRDGFDDVFERWTRPGATVLLFNAAGLKECT
jgi:hypothetical protein